MTDILYLQSDNLLEVKGLKNAAGGAYINNATVTVTVVDAGGAQVSGQKLAGDLKLRRRLQRGDYRLTLEDTLAHTENAAYTARVTALGDSLKRYFEHPLIAQMGT